MIRLVVSASLLASVGCSSWEHCSELELTAVDPSQTVRVTRYENARYRVVNEEPLTVEWEHVRCFDDPGEAEEEICAREKQRGQVKDVACR